MLSLVAQRTKNNWILLCAHWRKSSSLLNKGSPWEVEVKEDPQTMDSSSSNKKPMIVGGEGVRHFAAGKIASFDLDLQGKSRDSVTVSITSPSKRQLSSRIVDGPSGQHRVEFNPSEVGTYLIDITMDGHNIFGSPFVAKAYDSSLIRVSDVTSGAIGQPCHFRGMYYLIGTTLSKLIMPSVLSFVTFNLDFSG